MGLFDFVGDLLSSPTQTDDNETAWILFGDKSSGKHELMATIAYCKDYVEGFPHAKNFVDVWQKSFCTEDEDDGENASEDEFLLLGPDSQDSKRMLRNAKKYLRKFLEIDSDDGEVHPCFLVNLKEFSQEGSSTLRMLFALFLFFWRAILEINCSGQFKGDFNAASMDIDSDTFGDSFNNLAFDWILIVTHIDEIEEKSSEKTKQQFIKSCEKMKEDVLHSTFGGLFEQMFESVSIRLVFADLFHKKGRESFDTEFIGLAGLVGTEI